MSRSMALAQNVVDALIAGGVREVVLAPGSRSGPLALVLFEADKHGALRLHVRVDERTAGFLALGMAKASHRAVPVVTTSGTAVANLHPAMLEAKHARINLVAISADRPARLRGTGANQTTNQVGIFGDVAYAGLSATMRGKDVVRKLLESAGAGPAHLNIEFDEPLIADPATDADRNSQTFADVDRATPRAGSSATQVVEELLQPDQSTVVVAGDNATQAARRIAEAGNWPLFAEPSSGSRTGDHAIAPYRLLLEHSPLARQIQRVIVFGHPTLSRPITALLERDDINTIVVGADLFDFPNEGRHARLVGAVVVAERAASGWLDQWRTHAVAAASAIESLIYDGPLNGYVIARTVADAVAPGGLLYVGSSNAIRDLDLVGVPTMVGSKRVTFANRGLSGIDGTVSSAIGAALGRPSATAHALLGDLTFLHDANGLLIGSTEPRPDLTVVVASDDGGSIFATLEQGAPAYTEAFERVYATATGADIAAVCQGFGVDHKMVHTHEQLAAALLLPAAGIRVVEAKIERHDRRELARRLSVAVRDAIN